LTIEEEEKEEGEEDAASDKLALNNIEEIGPATEKRLRQAGFKSVRWINQLRSAIRLG
jgi:predicted flap endonuclease-1-like 5' DNA nuclease